MEKDRRHSRIYNCIYSSLNNSYIQHHLDLFELHIEVKVK